MNEPVSKKDEAVFVSTSPTFTLVIHALLEKLVFRKRIQIVLIEEDAACVSGYILEKIADVVLCEYDLGDFENKKGIHLFAEREELLLKRYRELICQLDAVNECEYFSTQSSQNDFKKFLARAIVADYGDRTSKSLLALHYSKNTHKNIERIFVEDVVPTSAVILPNGAKITFHKFQKLFLINSALKNFARLLLWRSNTLIRKESKPSYSNVEQRKVGIEYVKGATENGYGTDFDWFPHSDLTFSDVVYLLNDSEKEREVTISRFKENGLKCLNVYSRSLNFHSEEVQKDIKAAFQSLLYLWRSCRGSWQNKLYVTSNFAFYSCTKTFWVELFRSNNIFLLLGVGDTNLDALPKTHAIEHLGGIDLTYQFSATDFHAPMDSRPTGGFHHICWGQFSEDMLRKLQERVPYTITPTSCIFVGNQNIRPKINLLPTQKQFLREIRKAGSKKKVLIMDAATTRLKLFSRRKNAAFLDAVLELIDKKPNILFIFKPQRKLELSSKQMELMQNFQKEGRLLVAPAETLFHYLLPLVDLVIATPIYASALIESLSARKNIICFNQINWPHLLSNELNRELIVDDSNSLIQAFNKQFEFPKNISMSSKQFDPYCDGRGIERFAILIYLWISTLRTEGNATNSLDIVEKKYRQILASRFVNQAESQPMR